MIEHQQPDAPHDPILRQLYKELQRSPDLNISRMFNDRWSFTGCASADGFWLTTDQVRSLHAAGMIEPVTINGVLFEGDRQFEWGSFRVVMPTNPLTYNNVRLKAIVDHINHDRVVEAYEVLEAPSHVVDTITGVRFEARQAATILTALVEQGYDIKIQTEYRQSKSEG